MLNVIRDFLLEPAIVTTGLLVVPALVLLLVVARWRRGRGLEASPLPRLLTCAGVASGLTVMSILGFLCAAVMSGNDSYRFAAWAAVGLAWALCALRIGRLGSLSWAVGAGLGATAFALDTWITVAILFE